MVKTKVSGCFRTEKGGKDYLKIMSYVGTAQKQGYNAEAIKNAGSTDSQAIVDALQKIDFDGVTGHFTFDEEGNPKGKDITIIQVDNGELKFVTTVQGDN